MSRVRLPTGRAVDVHEASGQVDFLGTDATVDVVDLIALAAMFQACAYPVRRESGDSIPDSRLHDMVNSQWMQATGTADPPVLNKSGGRVVGQHVRTHEHFGHVGVESQCDLCGAAAGEECRL